MVAVLITSLIRSSCFNYPDDSQKARRPLVGQAEVHPPVGGPVLPDAVVVPPLQHVRGEGAHADGVAEGEPADGRAHRHVQHEEVRVDRALLRDLGKGPGHWHSGNPRVNLISVQFFFGKLKKCKKNVFKVNE